MDTRPEDPIGRRRDESRRHVDGAPDETTGETEESGLEARAAVLRRVVYGTPGGHESEAVGELAQVEAALARLRTPPADDESGSASATQGEGEADAAGSLERRRRRRRMRGVKAAAGLVAAVVVAALAVGPIQELLGQPRGLGVFDRAPVDVDPGPPGSNVVLDQRAASTLRHIGRVVGRDVWVFRDGTDICMITQLGEAGGWGANCVTEATFLDRGIRRYIPYDELCDETRPPGLEEGGAVLLTWNDDATEVEWSIVPISESGPELDGVRVPALLSGSARMTFEEWSSARLAERAGGS